MKSPYLGEEEDNFLQKKNAGSFIVLHALYMYLTWNTKFKKNTINVIDEGRRVGQQSTKTLTTRSSTKTQINKNTVSVISGDKRSTDALPTRSTT